MLPWYAAAQRGLMSPRWRQPWCMGPYRRSRSTKETVAAQERARSHHIISGLLCAFLEQIHQAHF